MSKALTVQSLERFKPDQNKRLEIPDGLLPGSISSFSRAVSDRGPCDIGTEANPAS